MKTSDMTKDQATALRAAHNHEVKHLTRMTRHELAAIEIQEGPAHLLGGPVTKDQLIAAIIERRYPIARQNEAAHVIGHHSYKWTACNWCHDDDGTHAGHLCECDRHTETDCTTCGRMAAFHFSATYTDGLGRPVLTDHGNMGHPYAGAMQAGV
jgi:hypothetical protein